MGEGAATVSATAGPAGPVSASAPVVAEQDRIPNGQKLAFALGGGSDVYGHQALADKLWLPYLNLGLAVSPVVAGFLLMYFRLLEAVLSPVFGTLSDNTRSRWGRRRPWIAVGALAMGLTFPLIFLPAPDWAPRATVLHILIVGTLFFGAYTMWSMPYFALGLEMTPSYDERTRLGAWMAMAVKVFTIPAGWILLFVSGGWFADAAGRPDLAAGVRAFGWIFAPVVMGLALLPAIFVRERYYDAEVVRQAPEPFWRSFRESAACRPLWPLILASALLVIGFSAVRSVGVYVNIYYVLRGDIPAATALEGLKYTVTFGVGLLSLPLLARLSERFDKRSVTVGLIAAAALGHLSNLVLLRPDMPYLQIIPAIFSAGLASSVWMFVPAMKADVADHDELATGKRREGSLNAFYGLFFKTAMVVSAGLGGFVLQATGFEVTRPAQSDAVLWRMVVAYSVVPAVIWGGCILAFRFYRLDRERLRQIRAALEARRGVI
ncbi:MFS transporter [Sphingomonas lenta]|uniref:Sodium:melibiose symporter n=1 Tax=Sphingomonas lenta TaxID=1141887 RepID=A0A2A2SJ67_9SPHN|nr:MFS transporter [Sphingomonas lenta]PAX09071.1 sodium:melibiose symporter [Sphingomonas lenta]